MNNTSYWPVSLENTGIHIYCFSTCLNASLYWYTCVCVYMNSYSNIPFHLKKVSESHSVLSGSLRTHGIVHGILQARILEWVAVPISRGSFQSRNQTQVSHMAGGFFTSWATREAEHSMPTPKLELLLTWLCCFQRYSCCSHFMQSHIYCRTSWKWWKNLLRKIWF